MFVLPKTPGEGEEGDIVLLGLAPKVHNTPGYQLTLSRDESRCWPFVSVS